MKFENLMYEGRIIKVVVDLESVFVENNDEKHYPDENSDTLDLTNITTDINLEKEDKNV